MNSSRSNLIRLASALAVVGLTLAACGSDDPAADDSLPAEVESESVPAAEPEPAPATTAEPEPEPEPAPATTAEPEPTTTSEPEPEPEPEPESAPQADGADCLIGDWKITDAEMNSYYDALAAGSSSPGAELSIDTTGEVLLSITDTTYEYVGNFDLTVSVVGLTGTGVASGTVDGTWVADGEVLETELGESDLNIIVTVSGATFDGSDIGNGFLQADPINNAPYSCDGPTLGFQAGPTDDIRHPVVLTPA